MTVTPSNFNLPDSAGATASERYLAQLCSNAFLRLWSYPNLYTDEGVSKNGIGKELADVTVFFGNDVILFSDKEAKLDVSQDPHIAWGRWYRKAIEKSVRQLHGAMKWVREQPGRIFVDKECKYRPSLTIPGGENVRFHLIATTRGTAPVVRMMSDHFEAEKQIPSLSIDTRLTGNEHLAAPLRLGRVSENHFVHVFDEAALSLVLSVFDTAADFIEYLTERARLLGENPRRVVCAGEEELVALFLSTMVEDESRHGFPKELFGSNESVIVLPHEHFESFAKRPEVARKIAADRSSYLIDRLVDRFIRTGDPTIAGDALPPHDLEIAIRALASESRFGRRVLADAIIDMLRLAESDPSSSRRARTLPSVTNEDTTVVALMTCVPDGVSYDEYRRMRSIALSNYIQCARLATPARSRYIGLGFDHPNSRHPGGSEDLALFIWPNFTAEDEAEIRRAADRMGIFGKGVVQTHYATDEFPAGDGELKAKVATSEKSKLNKRRRKMARKSRKANR